MRETRQTAQALPVFLALSVLVHGGFLWLVPAQARPATAFREQASRLALVSLPPPPRQASPPQQPRPPRPQQPSPPRPAPVEIPATETPAAVPVETSQETAADYDGPVEEQNRGAAFAGESGSLGALPVAAAADPALRENALGRYLATIRGLIDRRKEYPYQARRQEQEGSVLVRFTLTRQGALTGEPALEKKSRHGRLNASALEAVKNAAPYPPFPVEIADEEMSLQVAVNFSLN